MATRDETWGGWQAQWRIYRLPADCADALFLKGHALPEVWRMDLLEAEAWHFRSHEWHYLAEALRTRVTPSGELTPNSTRSCELEYSGPL
jgi:hypothetical protein